MRIDIMRDIIKYSSLASCDSHTFPSEFQRRTPGFGRAAEIIEYYRTVCPARRGLFSIKKAGCVGVRMQRDLLITATLSARPRTETRGAWSLRPAPRLLLWQLRPL